MRLFHYLKDHCIAYLIWFLSYAFMVVFLLAFQVNRQVIVAITVVFFLGMSCHEFWDFFRKKSFYDSLKNSLEELDKKYLLPEMLPEPRFYEGQLIFDALYACDKSMTEHVGEFERQGKEFREYIEMWVHEAKIPIASLQLMNHNHPGMMDERMTVQLKRMDDYIEHVLYYARSENAEKDYIIKPVSLKKIFSHVAVKNREVLQLAGAQLQTHGLDCLVMTDGKWMEFMIGQWMSNSLNYMSPERPLTICVSAKESETSTVLSFRDNGLGIPESDLPYVFQKSFTGQNGRKNSKSTGMGLYIVKNLCERLGHRIEVFSVQGEYTEFQMTFAKNDFYLTNL